MNDLDEFLSRPLAPVADGGFSLRVMRRVRLVQFRRHWKTAVLTALCVVLMLLVLPLHAIGAELGAALPRVAGLWALNLGAWLVAASLLVARQLARM